jgi:hypothetical protein
MTAHLGAAIIDLLEQAGEHHLGSAAPDAYAAFLLQVGGANTLRNYHPSATYWECVQATLDNFFTSAERAEICARLIGHAELRGRPEFRNFLAHALAERRVQEVLAAAVFARAAIGPVGAPARRLR